MPRTGLLIAVVLAAFAVCGGVLALALPGVIDQWSAANKPAAEHVQHRGHPKKGHGLRKRAHTTAPRPVAPKDNATDWLRLSLIWFGVWAVAGPLVLFGVLGCLLGRRRRRRRTRAYGLYEVHLSMHDEAKPQDLEDMVEAIGNMVREFPEQRARDGQPYIAFELHYGPADHGMEWTLAIRCEPDLATSIDGAIAAAYPDVRVGHTMGQDPRPIRGALPVPGHVLRFRKDRPFVYALNSETDKDASAPIEAIAQAQVSLGKPSSVRIQIIPAPLGVEAFARRRYHRHENKLVRQETWGMREAGLQGSLNRQEMMEAKRTQNRGMFWLEVQVAAASREDANRVASAVQARRGDNRLHRRWMIFREDLYRRRFPTAQPPLLPTFSLRSLASAAEIATLLRLPSARMKGVPVRRLTVPRLPAPPEVNRTADTVEPPVPQLPVVATADLPLPPAAV